MHDEPSTTKEKDFYSRPAVVAGIPNIRSLALKILACPASDCTVERLFSHGSDVVGDDRHSLAPRKVEVQTLLKSNRARFERFNIYEWNLEVPEDPEDPAGDEPGVAADPDAAEPDAAEPEYLAYLEDE